MSENTQPKAFTIMEQPKLGDQMITAAVGSVVTLVASVALSAASQGLQSFVQNRKAKKLAEEDAKNLDDKE